MKPEETTIQCPSCGSAINVNDILTHQISDAVRKEYEAKANQEKQALKLQVENLATEKAQFEAKKQKENELFAERLAKDLKEEKNKIVDAERKKAQAETADKLELMQKELGEQSEKIKESHKKDGEIAKLKREKMEMKDAIEAEAQKKLTEHLNAERIKIKQQAEAEHELKEATLKKQLEDQKKLMDEMVRKHEQGSMQLQGEIMELAIEDYLAITFPLDTINEIKKGANGADCVQIVNTREVQNCGVIYYESKRAKNFQPAWLDKFKTDLRIKKADIGILVTECLPADMLRMGLKDGIWICTFQEFKGLSGVIRESIIQLNKAMQTQENKGDKMVMLYDFLTGNEFRLQVESIVEAFEQMQSDLNKEKIAMQRIWAQREKQLDKVIQNTAGMHGAIKGIAGNAVQTIISLELDTADNLLLEN